MNNSIPNLFHFLTVLFYFTISYCVLCSPFYFLQPHSISFVFYSVPFHSISIIYILFHFIFIPLHSFRFYSRFTVFHLFYSLFYSFLSIPFNSPGFCSIPFYFVQFYSSPVSFVLPCSIPILSILFNLIPFHSNLLYLSSKSPFYSHLSQTILFSSPFISIPIPYFLFCPLPFNPFHLIPLLSIQFYFFAFYFTFTKFHSFLFYSTMHSVPFTSTVFHSFLFTCL